MFPIKHIPVMLLEVIDYLNINSTGIYIDCTLGSGGHSEALLKKLPQAKIIAFDQDKEAIKFCQKNPLLHNVTFINDNFFNFSQHLEKLKITEVDGFLFDLGISNEQLKDAKRGFSYRLDSPLDMRMNQTEELTAYKIINEYNCEKMADIFFKYGEENKSRFIARKICNYRQKEKINTTQQLVKIVAGCFPYKKKKHPARKVFQALRIAVNQELTSLSLALEKATQFLKENGRIVVISYHSLEDRIVKHTFKKFSENKLFKMAKKKPLLPSCEEMITNHQARSAKMRILVYKII